LKLGEELPGLRERGGEQREIKPKGY